MTFWRNKKITFFQWQKQPSIEMNFITLSTSFGGWCKAKNTAFHSKRNLEEMSDERWTPNIQPQSRKFVKKKKKLNVFKLKKPKVCSCVSAFSQPSRQPIHQISLRYNVVSLAWLCSSPPLLVSVCYVCICDCIQYVLYSVL